MENKTGQLAAALRRLPQYTHGTLPAIFLVTDEEWRDAGKNIRRLARQTAATGLPAVSTQDILKAIEQAPTEQIRIALLITWACCARAGDVTQLKQHNTIKHTRLATWMNHVVMMSLLHATCAVA